MDSDSEGSISFNLLDKGLEDILSGHKSKELNVLYIYGDHNEVALRVFNEILGMLLITKIFVKNISKQNV